jgi:tRNA(Ile)-lysidine synthase TilS/MesJ
MIVHYAHNKNVRYIEDYTNNDPKFSHRNLRRVMRKKTLELYEKSSADHISDKINFYHNTIQYYQTLELLENEEKSFFNNYPPFIIKQTLPDRNI